MIITNIMISSVKEMKDKLLNVLIGLSVVTAFCIYLAAIFYFGSRDETAQSFFTAGAIGFAPFILILCYYIGREIRGEYNRSRE